MLGSFRYGVSTSRRMQKLCNRSQSSSSFLQPKAFQIAGDLVSQGKVNLRPLITHTFPFKDAETAYNALVNGVGPDGKPPIKAVILGPEV